MSNLEDIEVRLAAVGEAAPNVKERVAIAVLILFVEKNCEPGPMTNVIATVQGYLERTKPVPCSASGGAA